MANVDVMRMLYSKRISPLDFKWDTLLAPPLLSLLSIQDIYSLNQIAMSNKLAAKPQEKYKLIDQIMLLKGFKQIASGTNRIAYKCLNNQSIVIKIALDRVGIKDNPAEFVNQFKLKPFVVKVFEVSQCGTVGLFERVEPIVSREEFLHISNDVFDLLVEKIIGKYVVEDVGSSFFQNYGLRLGWGPVLLDFPYVYDLDGNKMYCNRLDPESHEYCLGEIDYDMGFNKLLCTKCGKRYFAKQLEKQVENKTIVITKGDKRAMEIILTRGDEIVETIKSGNESKTILSKEQSMDIQVKNMNRFEKDKARKDRNKEDLQKMREFHNSNRNNESIAKIKPKPVNDEVVPYYISSTNEYKSDESSIVQDTEKIDYGELSTSDDHVLDVQKATSDEVISLDKDIRHDDIESSISFKCEKYENELVDRIASDLMRNINQNGDTSTVIETEGSEVVECKPITVTAASEIEDLSECNANTSVNDYDPGINIPVKESHVKEDTDSVEDSGTSWTNPKLVSDLIIELETNNDMSQF